MKSVDKFNALIGSKVSREAIGEIIELAKSENNTAVIYRLFKVLNDNPYNSFFEITDLTVYPAIPTGLNGVQHSGSYKEALDNCGRLNPGFKFENGTVVKAPEAKVKAAAPKVVKPNGQKVAKKQQPNRVEKNPTPIKPKDAVTSNVQKVAKKEHRNYGQKRKFEAKPKSYSTKPKSVSVQTAITDVLSLEKYKKLKPMQANLLFKIFKEDIDLEYEPTEFEAGVLRNVPRAIAYASDWTVSLENTGQEFIQAVNGRIESLRNQKNNYALFDGLKSPVVETAGEEPKTAIVEEKNSDPVQSKVTVADTKEIKKLKDLGFVSAAEVPDEPKDVFVLPGEIGIFIQKIQPHKALIIIKGTKHTSKSQLTMQIANAFGEMGKPVAYIDYEQGGLESKDTVDSVNRNTTEAGRKNILIKGHLEKPFEELKKFCEYCGVIAADSVTDLGITADQLNELRTSYPKVIWIFISQVKENGEMYGGNKMAHNPTCIIKCHPSHDPKLRYATLEKNRGNNLELMYWIMDKKIKEPEATEIEAIDVPAEVQPVTTNKFSFQT